MELEFGVFHKTTLPFILWKKHTEHCGDLKYKISTNPILPLYLTNSWSFRTAKTKKIFQILISSRWLFSDYQHYLLQLFSILAHFAFIEWIVNSAWCFREGQNRYILITLCIMNQNLNVYHRVFILLEFSSVVLWNGDSFKKEILFLNGRLQIGYCRWKIILNLPPFWNMDKELQEWKNSKNEMKGNESSSFIIQKGDTNLNIIFWLQYLII